MSPTVDLAPPKQYLVAFPRNIHSIYAVVSGYFRKKRMAQFQGLFNVTSQTRVLDNGGSEFNWALASCDPRLTILNLGFNRSPANGTRYVAAMLGVCLLVPDPSTLSTAIP